MEHIRTVDDGNDKYALKVDTDNGEIEGLTVTNAGNVGIGTINPRTNLSVTGNSGEMNDDGIFQITTGTGAYIDYKLAFGVLDNSYAWIQSLKPGTSTIPLSINPSGGNVGIGTTTPADLLQVGNLIIGGDNNRALYSTPNYDIMYKATDDASHLFYTYGQERLRIDASGKVCIGTTTPQARLTIGGFGHGVLGGITMTPDNDDDGGHYMTFTNADVTLTVGYIARSGNGVIYGSSSDYRLKENVVNIDIYQAKSRLMSLRPVEYNYISDENKTVISGFLAHEMADAGFANGVTGEKDAVDKDGKPIYQAIDTKFLIPEMVKVIQEQQKEIDDLKAELKLIKQCFSKQRGDNHEKNISMYSSFYIL